jgi:hypothetical protein
MSRTLTQPSGRERSLHAITGVQLPSSLMPEFQRSGYLVRDGNMTNNNAKQRCNELDKSTTANKGTLENSSVLVGCSSLEAAIDELGLIGPVPQSTSYGFMSHY